METHATRDWRRIRAEAGPYPPEAYVFVQEGLRFTAERVAEEDSAAGREGRHVTGQELCLGLRDYAIDQFGPLAGVVMDHWRVRGTEDFGRIVFAMVEAGLLRTTDEDSIEDFRAVFDFGEAFAAAETG